MDIAKGWYGNLDTHAIVISALYCFVFYLAIFSIIDSFLIAAHSTLKTFNKNVASTQVARNDDEEKL